MNTFDSIKLTTVTALIAASGALARPAAAFSELGHRTVAVIGQDLASPETRKAIKAILGDGVSLDQIAVCADDIKRRATNCAGFQIPIMKETSGWHFVDDPVDDTLDATALANLPNSKYCKNDNCAINAIQKQYAVLRNPSSDRYHKQLALMFIVHLVGDLYQPMHCVNGTFQQKEDAGGNAEPFPSFATPSDKWPMNLHHLWDNLIMSDAEEAAIDPHDLAQRLESSLKGRRDVNITTLAAAARDSHDWAKKWIYPDYEKNRGKGDRSAYQAEFQKIIFSRVAHAGETLASLLDDAFAPKK